MTRYSYFYVPEENLHAVIVTLQRKGDTHVAMRPDCAYFNEKTAKIFVEKANQAASENKPLPRRNPPIDYRFTIPKWWSNRFPNWNHMYPLGT